MAVGVVGCSSEPPAQLGPATGSSQQVAGSKQACQREQCSLLGGKVCSAMLHAMPV
jgi:hypothetical protein